MEGEAKKQLVALFGERAAFHRIERLLYASDLASLPGIVTCQIKTMPDAVVQPRTGEELSALVRLAAMHAIPLVPRGAGSAGYGGAVPVKGGIVVDFSRMNKIIEVNPEKKVVTVEPGVIWNDLEKTLRSQGLALRMYPGSAISATVAGWIANGGGIGIGGFEYGYLKDTIVELELITPKGIERIDQHAVDLVEGMAGTTGLISRVALRARGNEKDVPVVAAFPTLEGLVEAMGGVREDRLPLWEVGYKDQRSVELTEQAVQKQAQKGPLSHTAHEPHLPRGYLGAFVYPEGRKEAVEKKLIDIIRAAGGEVFRKELADFEWAERFYGMRLKALGPSTIPSEVILPTARLLEFVAKVRRKIKGLAFNGTLVAGGKECAFLGYRLDDERRRGYALAFVNSLIPLKEAAKLGGRPYTTGMLLSNHAVSCLGKERLEKAFAFKTKVDPAGIMNPGKVFPAALDRGSPTKMLHLMTKVAAGQIAAIKTVDALFGGKPQGLSIPGKTSLGAMPFGKELAWDAFACANCGYCRADCTEFRAIGWESASPRGKFRFLREYMKGAVAFDERMAEMFFACTTCARCNDACHVRASIEEHWGHTMRPLIWRQGFNPPAVHMKNVQNILVHHNAQGKPQSERKAWMTSDLKYKEEGEIGYFAGCNVSFMGPTKNLAVHAVRLLNAAGIEPAYLGTDEWCCGGTMYVTGCLDEAMETVEHNIDELKKRGIKTLITSCSGCWLHFAHFYPVLAQRAKKPFPVKVYHITQTISSLMEAGRLECRLPVNLKATYHDPCHIGRGGGIYEEPRKILRAIPGLEVREMPRNKEQAACCGRHMLRYPRLGMAMHNDRLDEVKATGVPVLIGACPNCETNFRLGIAETGSNLEVLDISDLVCQSVGIPTLVTDKFKKLGVV